MLSNAILMVKKNKHKPTTPWQCFNLQKKKRVENILIFFLLFLLNKAELLRVVEESMKKNLYKYSQKFKVGEKKTLNIQWKKEKKKLGRILKSFEVANAHPTIESRIRGRPLTIMMIATTATATRLWWRQLWWRWWLWWWQQWWQWWKSKCFCNFLLFQKS